MLRTVIYRWSLQLIGLKSRVHISRVHFYCGVGPACWGLGLAILLMQRRDLVPLRSTASLKLVTKFLVQGNFFLAAALNLQRSIRKPCDDDNTLKASPELPLCSRGISRASLGLGITVFVFILAVPAAILLS